MSKRVIGIGAGVLILAVIVGFNVTRDSRSRVTVQTRKAGKSDLVSIVSASGEVRPKRFVNVSANVSGRITYLPVKEGDTVKKGQVLARIDSTREQTVPEPTPRTFGDGIITDKPLDEVILAYLVEKARHRKRLPT